MTMTQRVLCVDDEDLIRDALSFFFEHLGLEARCCSNGRELIQIFEKAPDAYDLVLVNYDMPGMNGAEVVRRLRTIDANKRISLTSAYPEAHVQKTLAEGAVGEFLPKPYSLGKLRGFLLRNLAPRIANAFVLATGGGAGRPWLKALQAAERSGALRLRVHSDPAEVLANVLEGFPNVIVWELDSGYPRIVQLEKLKSEGIPIVFIGANAEDQGLDRFGKTVSATVPGDEAVEAVRLAARGVHFLQS